jgi:hypothetical protein
VTHTPHLAAAADHGGPSRSLVLAGGGVRVAWQAGVLLALEQAGIAFDHADGTSGGTFNLSMLLSGLSPAEMCERWRTLNPLAFVSPLPLRTYLRSPRLPGLSSPDGIVDRVFPHLGIDVERIRAARGLPGTYNVCDFKRKVSVAFSNEQIVRELLVAGVTLPIVTPPVAYDGGLWLDAIWIRDANLLEGTRRGCDELWLAWCIGNDGFYRDGSFRQYVHMIEIAANGSLNGEIAQIRELNERIAGGEAPGGRTMPVRLHVIRPDVPIPLDPDYLLGRIDAATLVGLGYRAACRYLDVHDPAGVSLDETATRMRDGGPGLGFRERAHGAATIDGVAGALELRLSVEIGELDRFLADPAAGTDAALVGELRHPAFSAAMLRSGRFRVDGRHVVYEGAFRAAGRSFTLSAARSRRPGAALDVAVAAVGDIPTRVRLSPSRADAADRARSLHARRTPNLPDGARTVGRFMRLMLR